MIREFDDGFRIRTMTRPELDYALDLAAASGWNPGLGDGDPFWAADPEGFYLAELPEGGGWRRVGSVSAVRYGAGFAFLGFYVIEPELRGHGYGLRLSGFAIDSVRDRNAGLDGVLEMQAKYAGLGFRWAFRSLRYEGPAEQVLAKGDGGAKGVEVAPLADVDFAQVLAYDRRCFPEAREAFLRLWVAAPGAGALALPGPGGRLRGYGVVRPCRVGHKIGPLFADGPAEAEALLDALAAHAARAEGYAGAPLYFDVTEAHPQAVALAEARGMAPMFATARMYSKGEPDYDRARVWGVTSFELG